MEIKTKKIFEVGDEVLFRNVFSLINRGRIIKCVRKNGQVVEYVIMTANSELSINKNDVIRKILSDNDVINKIVLELSK